MSKTIIFLRLNKNNISYNEEQKEIITKYLLSNSLLADDKIAIEINNPDEERKILHLLKTCPRNVTLIVSDINSFGRTIKNILEIIKYFLDNNIRIIAIKQNLDLVSNKDTLTKVILNIITMTIKLEKNLMSLRTKEALILKKNQGVILGKPKGTIQKSKFDEQKDKIQELLSLGLSVRKISKLLGYNNHIGLNNYVKKRNMREEFELKD